MAPKRNLAPLAGLLLGVAAVVGYFALVLQRSPSLSAFLDFPLASLILAAAGVFLSGLGIRRAFGQPRLYRGRVMAPVLGILNGLLCGFFVYYLFVGSYSLPEAVAAPAVGAPAPPFELADHRGRTVRLSDLRGRNVLLVFYRGFW